MAPRGVCHVVLLSTVLLAVCQVCSGIMKHFGASHEFNVHVPGVSAECFYQDVQEGQLLYTRVDVLRGGDGLVDVDILDGESNRIYNQTNAKNASYHMEKVNNTGTFSVCVYNMGYGEKIVHFYITTVFLEVWHEFRDEMEEMENITTNFTSSIDIVSEQVTEMTESQMIARVHMMSDWYAVKGNNYYVLAWSLAQCILIVVSAFTQVYTVRRLFRHVNVTPTLKPRA